MRLSEYNYDLPDILIAQRALKNKDDCKLMIVKKNFSDKRFYDIIDYLEKGDVLVLNDTRVVKRKFLGRKETGSLAEVVLLKKISRKIYEAKIKTKNPHKGTRIILKKGYIDIIDKKNIDTFIVKINSKELLKDAILPTPPYIHRTLENSEYQTIYSKKDGSLASPTAGLHFTKKLLERIKEKGVKIRYVTLHVSYGTFKNIDDIKTYSMDSEYYEIPKNTATAINNRKGRLVVIGTTTLKTLESSSKNGKIKSEKGFSTLFIYPPFKFNSEVDILVTNFHLPKSTLLLLTCAFGGRKRIFDAYKHAVLRKYRFFSLGDAMMVYKK